MKHLLTILFCLLALAACRKSGLLSFEHRVLVQEYPSLQPISGATVTLYKCKSIDCSTVESMGDFKTNAQGEVSHEESFLANHSTKIAKPGFVLAKLRGEASNDGAEIYYMVRPSWLHIIVSNAQPLTELDSCFIKEYQRDSLLVGRTPYQGILKDNPLLGTGSYYLNGFPGTEFVVLVAGGMYASFEARVVRNGVSRDTVVPIFCPPNDTAFLHFQY